MAFFSTILAVFILAFQALTHITNYSPPAAKLAGPLHLHPHALHYQAEKNIDDNVVFCPLPVSNNMLVIIISFTILGLLFRHFFPWSSVNDRNWLLNYYSGLCNGADSRILLFFDNWM